MMKGQLTIEYLVILVIMILLFTGISLDLARSSIENGISLQAGEMIYAADLLVTNSVHDVSLQGVGAKKTINLRAPPDCSFTVSSTEITAACSENAADYDGKVIGPEGMPSGVTYSCQECVNGVIDYGEMSAVQIAKE